jgi:hypothetical protein
VRSNFLVEIQLPVHPFGDGFDHQVDIFQVRQIVVVVRRDDRSSETLVGQRGRRQLGKVGDRLDRDAALGALFRGQVKKHGLDTGVGQVGGDLRAHDACAKHGGFADA